MDEHAVRAVRWMLPPRPIVRRIIQDSVRIQDYTMRALTDTEQRA